MRALKSAYIPICLMISMGAITGCNGEIYTEVSPSVYGDTKSDTAYKKYNGVYYFLPIYIKETWETTTLVGPDGKEILAGSGSSVQKCKPMVFETTTIGADYTKPARLFYSPGLLEKNTFKVEFNENGTLKSVNSESTPDKGETLKNVAATIAGIAPLFAASSANTAQSFVENSASALPYCNSGKRVTGYEPIKSP